MCHFRLEKNLIAMQKYSESIFELARSFVNLKGVSTFAAIIAPFAAIIGRFTAFVNQMALKRALPTVRFSTLRARVPVWMTNFGRGARVIDCRIF